MPVFRLHKSDYHLQSYSTEQLCTVHTCDTQSQSDQKNILTECHFSDCTNLAIFCSVTELLFGSVLAVSDKFWQQVSRVAPAHPPPEPSFGCWQFLGWGIVSQVQPPRFRFVCCLPTALYYVIVYVLVYSLLLCIMYYVLCTCLVLLKCTCQHIAFRPFPTNVHSRTT